MSCRSVRDDNSRAGHAGVIPGGESGGFLDFGLHRTGLRRERPGLIARPLLQCLATVPMFPTSPALVRAAPFAAFVAALALRAFMEGSSALDARWLYAVQVVAPLALLFAWRHRYAELCQAIAPLPCLAAVAAGGAMFWAWIHGTQPWMMLGSGAASFAPQDGQGVLRWDLIGMRLCGAVLVVPLMEEIFWRSFLMRWIDRRDFLPMAPQRASLAALGASSAVFALAHPLWLAGLAAGLLYGTIYRISGNLWYAIIAHATTNLALGAWVIQQRAWNFW